MSAYISVVVPTCHRNDLLRSCLTRLLPAAQSLEASYYEIIVSDDGRKSTARQMIETEFPFVKWVAGPLRGPAANRNNGARQASGQWLAFLDDDCQPDCDWLAAIYDLCRTGEVDVIEGQTVIPDKVDNPFLRGIENLHGGLFWTCNLVVRKDLFDSLGGFDEDFLEPGGEDMEFAWRCLRNKVRTGFCPQALVLHPVRINGIKELIWRCAMSRWLVLFYHKTGQAAPLSTAAWKALWCLAVRELTNQARRTWHFVKGKHSYWRTGLFDIVWGWLTFPFVLPYMLYWELCFRHRLKHRSEFTGQ